MRVVPQNTTRNVITAVLRKQQTSERIDGGSLTTPTELSDGRLTITPAKRKHGWHSLHALEATAEGSKCKIKRKTGSNFEKKKHSS
jgi:hypothetical protein